MFAITMFDNFASGGFLSETHVFENKTQARHYCKKVWDIVVKKGQDFEEVLYMKLCGENGGIMVATNKKDLVYTTEYSDLIEYHTKEEVYDN